jgi:putative phosphoserine phosphatase/1-acylglycerol-3-phosphate O-acyltransferase
MTVHQDVIRNIQSAPDGPQIGAFFDFDGTLIAGYSATVFIKEQIRRGDVSPLELVELLSAAAQFSLGKTGFSGLMTTTAQFMRGVAEEDYIRFGEELYQQQIARKVYPESRALVQAHMDKGHTVAVISSATPYQVEPVAQDLDIEHIICSRYEVKDGVFTGGIVRPLCFGEGKVLAAENLASEHGIDLRQSFFYSDSDDDIQLLERVGHPQVLNPNTKLTEIAESHGWPVRRFRSRGQPRVTDLIRSVAASVALIPSFIAGLPIYALTGSRREALNFAISLFADISSALIGLNLVVRGEHNLWQQRPAVFIFNHQSKADLVIMTKLLRRDIAGVGKKEIKDMPLIGKTLELAGVVFIDRANTSSAIEMMKPLVDAMRNRGKSVVIAPEGTRSITPRLAPFKKGAFYLAMQAGVPLVPVVIHNAGDVAPKGDFVFRPATVEVDVLPPVDTSKWRRKTLGKHVAEVRGMFLQTLRQLEQGDFDALPRDASPKKPPTVEQTAEAVAGTSPAAKPPAAEERPAPKKSTPKKSTPEKSTPEKITPEKSTQEKAGAKKIAGKKKKIRAKAAPTQEPAGLATPPVGKKRRRKKKPVRKKKKIAKTPGVVKKPRVRKKKKKKKVVKRAGSL